MQYMLLIYAEEGGWDQIPADAQQAELAKWFTYSEEMKAAGVMIAGDALQPTASATSVSAKSGEVLVTDGPFAETKEALGGYYLMNVESLDEAIVWAKKCPGASYGTIELRPLMVFDQ
jgi:hypothetical protein